MSIVLNETEWVEEMMESSELGPRPYETIRRIARKYFDEGLTKQDVRKCVHDYIKQCDPYASIPKWSNMVEAAINRAKKRPAICIDCIPVTRSEMETIDGLGGRLIQKLAFTLLVLAKYWVIVNPKCDYWVTTPDSEIMKMANIRTSLRRQCDMYRSLSELGLVKFSKIIDNTSVRVCFADDDSEVVMKITDVRNLGYQYHMYHGESYYICQNCGITTKRKPGSKGRPPKYCPTCASKIRIKQNVDSVMRGRKKQKNV